jgi:hypothetical protein
VIGLLIALTIAGLRYAFGTVLPEDVFIESARFLFWWYLATSLMGISLGALAWAGDLGVEGARLRHGVATALGWMLGVPRLPLQYVGILLFLTVRRTLFIAGAYLWTRGLQAVGATFTRDDQLLLIGAILLGLGILSATLNPLVRRLAPPLELKSKLDVA